MSLQSGSQRAGTPRADVLFSDTPPSARLPSRPCSQSRAASQQNAHARLIFADMLAADGGVRHKGGGHLGLLYSGVFIPRIAKPRYAGSSLRADAGPSVIRLPGQGQNGPIFGDAFLQRRALRQAKKPEGRLCCCKAAPRPRRKRENCESTSSRRNPRNGWRRQTCSRC